MVDFEKHREESLADYYRTGGAAAGALTVRDYFAARAMQALLSDTDWRQDMECWDDAAFAAYKVADAIMKERNKKQPQQAMTAEEAFGL
jgi:hypothetical protein